MLDKRERKQYNVLNKQNNTNESEEMKMTKEAVIKQVIELLESNDTEKENEAFELAYKFDIALTEIWDDEDEEIIGMMVEDTTLYF